MVLSNTSVLILLIFPLIASAGQISDMLRPKTIRVFKLEGSCPEHKDVLAHFEDMRIGLSNRVNILNFKMIVKHTINDTLKLKLMMKRCKSREALDSCEIYQTINLNRLCDLISGDNKPWTPMFKVTRPRIECPIQKGVYTITNGTLDGSPLATLPIAGWYWVITSYMMGENTNKVYLCTIMEGQLVPV